MKNILWLVVVIAALLLGYKWSNKPTSVISSYNDTIVVRDTIRDTVPVPKDSVIIKWRTVQAERIDTITNIVLDTVNVVLPITQKEYVDTNYHAWVSGFEPVLDSIYVFPTTTIINNTHTIYKQKRWGIGVQLGVGAHNGGVKPYIGIGISYNLWNF